MNRPLKKEWLEPFRVQAELDALDYEAFFELRLPRRTALNRLSRLREAGLVERHGQARSTVYRLTDAGGARLVIESARQSVTLPQRGDSIRGAVGDPDPFRVKYRQAIAGQVAEIIRARCSRREAVARLRRWAEDSVIETDRKPFVAAAEETLADIHEGNFARYRVRPSEFEAWKAAWSEAGSAPT